eukprot:491053-Hanusia_phi.AAC.2
MARSHIAPPPPLPSPARLVSAREQRRSWLQVPYQTVILPLLAGCSEAPPSPQRWVRLSLTSSCASGGRGWWKEKGRGGGLTER